MPSSPIVSVRPISGFASYSEAETAALERCVQTLEKAYRAHGFARLYPRPFELREVLLAKGGIQKQIFGVSRLPGDNATDLALPFDRTVPMAVWIAQRVPEIAFPYKRFDISYSFRGERAQAGRFQGFLQADIDVVGYEELDLSADAGCVAVIYEALGKLAFGPVRVAMSHMSFAAEALQSFGIDESGFRPAMAIIDKLGKIEEAEAAAELQATLGLQAAAALDILQVFSYEGTLEGICEISPRLAGGKGMEDLRTIFAMLEALGVSADDFLFSPRIVRGLDYYSGMVFETTLVGRESVGSIASGGRYDDLASIFCSSKLPGVGGSIGLTRLFDTALREGLVDLSTRCDVDVFVGYRTASQRLAAQGVAKDLRAKGLSADLYMGSQRIGGQLAYANRKGIPVALMVMDTESFVVRDMRGGVQQDLRDAPAAIAELEQLRARTQMARQ